MGVHGETEHDERSIYMPLLFGKKERPEADMCDLPGVWIEAVYLLVERDDCCANAVV